MVWTWKGLSNTFLINNYLIFKLIYFLNEGMIYIFFFLIYFPFNQYQSHSSVKTWLSNAKVWHWKPGSGGLGNRINRVKGKLKQTCGRPRQQKEWHDHEWHNSCWMHTSGCRVTLRFCVSLTPPLPRQTIHGHVFHYSTEAEVNASVLRY